MFFAIHSRICFYVLKGPFKGILCRYITAKASTSVPRIVGGCIQFILGSLIAKL